MHILAKICRERTRKSLLSTTKIDVLAALPTTFTCYLIFFKPLVSPKLIVCKYCYQCIHPPAASLLKGTALLRYFEKHTGKLKEEQLVFRKSQQKPKSWSVTCMWQVKKQTLKIQRRTEVGMLPIRWFVFKFWMKDWGKKIHLSHMCWIQDVQFLPLNTY